ncbi:MAG: phage portal protein, partial [bacterium]
HNKLISKNGLMGINPLEAARLSLNLNYKSETTVDKFYTNNANTTKVLESNGDPKNLNKFDEAVKKWKENNQGYQNSGDILTLPVGTQLKELKLSVEDSKFLETASFSAKSLGALFGVPLQLLGHAESKYSDFEQSALNFKVNTLASILSNIKNELEFKLLSNEERKQGISIEFDTKSLIETSLSDKANFYKTMLMMGAASLDDVAIENGFQPLGGEIGQTKWLQKQMTPVSFIYETNQQAINNNNDKNNKTDE